MGVVYVPGAVPEKLEPMLTGQAMHNQMTELEQPGFQFGHGS